MNVINIVFYGTGNFAATILKIIAHNPKFRINAVITQPDRPAGRNHKLLCSPVKAIGHSLNIKIYQPESLKNFEAAELNDADVALVTEYGLIVPERLINLPKNGTVNLHASLLPKYRGASPIQEAIKNGDNTTGVTLMVIDKEIDHGPIICAENVEINADETQKDLLDKLGPIAGHLFVEKIPLWLNREITASEQDHNQATFCHLIKRDDGRIDFSLNSKRIFDLWRALMPWPGIWADCNGSRLKLSRIARADKSNLKPGQIIFENDKIFIGCGNNESISALELQPESKKIMSAKMFINGHRQINGSLLK